jgi:hypothetical protein
MIESGNRKTMLSLSLCTIMLVGFILWHYPPRRATDLDNGIILVPALTLAPGTYWLRLEGEAAAGTAGERIVVSE